LLGRGDGGLYQERMSASPPAPRPYQPPTEPGLAVVHADAHLLVLDKPCGLLTVPGKGPELADCLAARAAARFAGARIVHRLDMDTSGLVVLAMTGEAHRHLGLQFERRHVAKTYVARVAGHVAEDSGVIELPLRCDWPNRPLQMVDHEEGRAAVTRYEVLARAADGTSRLALYPLTGRSHQLRVHLLALGHPILGDPFYGDAASRAAAARLQLHAERLELHHPQGGGRVAFHAPCPF
jgi:tRNA pseudouridine32 synthase/23S rRNA pseudouridine746 synthase